MSFLCRVPGFCRLLKTALGEQRNVTLVKAKNAPGSSAPPSIRTFCIESDDRAVDTAAACARGVKEERDEPGESGSSLVELEARILPELARVLTKHPSSRH